MIILDSDVDKKSLLDILAYLLWEEKATNELSMFHIDFTKSLYKKILEEIKRQVEQWQDSSYRDDFSSINLECRDMSDLFFLEKRLEKIEQILTERK